MPVIGEVTDWFRGVHTLTRASLQNGFADSFTVADFAYESLTRMTHRGVCNFEAGDQLISTEPMADRLARLHMPVLVIWGAQDNLAPTTKNVERYTRAGMKPQVMPGSGHSPMIEKPDAFLAVLRPFIA